MSDENIVHVEIPIPDAPQRPVVGETPRRAPDGSQPRADCDICGKNYSVKHLYSHRRKVHGIFGGRTGVTRKPYKRRKKTMEMEVAPKSNGHKATPLSPLTAEQITRAAAESLWDTGVPHDKLAALLRWNIQTHYFLSEVQT